MKWTQKSIVLGLLMVAFCCPAEAFSDLPEKGFFQEQPAAVYTGNVLNRQNKPVAGAKLTLSGSEASTRTDSKGAFSIQAEPGDTLIITHPAYTSVQQVLTDNRVLSFQLESDNEAIPLRSATPVQQIFTTFPARLAIASNDAVYHPELIKSPVTSVRNAVIGRLTGLYTLQSSGQPGNDGAAWLLRGQTPLIMMDGVPVGITSLDLEEIESVTVLKDALGTAPLGVRGSNGVLLITTRKGSENKLQVSFTAQTAIQKPVGWNKTLGAYDYARLYNEALVNDGLAPLYPDSVLNAYRTHSNPLRYPDVNWRNEILEKSSMLSRYTLSATGGNRFARYFVSLEHLNQQGFFKTVDSNTYNTNNDFKSYVIRSNVDVSVNSKVSGGIYLLGRILNANEPGATTQGILNSLLNTPNNAYPVFQDNGYYGGTQQFQNNIWAQAVGSGYRQNYKRDMLVNFYLKRTLDELLKGLFIQARVAYNATISENINRSKTFAVYQRMVNSTGQVSYQQYGTNGTQANSSGLDYQGRADYEEIKLGYDRTVNEKHGLSAYLLANRDNSVDGSDLPYTITGASGRLAYSYGGRYMIEGAFGYNGSNRYPEKGDTKRGFTPAIGLGWNISEERFMKDLNWINGLKLFTSYGRTAWDSPGYFTYYQRYFDAATTYFGTSASGNTSIAEQTLANRNITWEKANKFNAGLTGVLIDQHLDLTVEYYNNKYFDLLQQRGRNTTLIGNDYPNENIGQQRYTGWEMKLGWQELKTTLQYFVKGNVNIQHSKVLFSDEVYRPYEWMKRTGKMVGQRFGYIAEGLYQSQAEINGSATTVGYIPQPGDIKYKDLNGDGRIDQFDVAPIGGDKPLVFYGLGLGATWKGIDVSALLQGVTNRDIYLGGASLWAFQNNGFGQAYEDNLNRWTPATAATATYPRLNVGANANNQATSSFWLASGNYLRLKNIEVGYTLPGTLTSKAHLQSARIFISGYNLLTFSDDKLGDRDPEVSSTFSYPLQKLYNFGINIKF